MILGRTPSGWISRGEQILKGGFGVDVFEGSSEGVSGSRVGVRVGGEVAVAVEVLVDLFIARIWSVAWTMGEGLSKLIVSISLDWSGAAPGIGLQQVDIARINIRVSIPKRIGMKSKRIDSRWAYYTRRNASRIHAQVNAHSHLSIKSKKNRKDFYQKTFNHISEGVREGCQD
jgi:hypothetical protein